VNFDFRAAQRIPPFYFKFKNTSGMFIRINSKDEFFWRSFFDREIRPEVFL